MAYYKLMKYIEDHMYFEATHEDEHMTLQQLIEMRQLLQDAIVDSHCAYSPTIFDPIFKEKE